MYDTKKEKIIALIKSRDMLASLHYHCTDLSFDNEIKTIDDYIDHLEKDNN